MLGAAPGGRPAQGTRVEVGPGNADRPAAEEGTQLGGRCRTSHVIGVPLRIQWGSFAPGGEEATAHGTEQG